jgi:hypothetical protein
VFKLFELGIATHVMKVHGGMERWPHNHKGMKHEVEIMVIDVEQSYQGKGINIGCYFCRSKMSREVIDRV